MVTLFEQDVDITACTSGRGQLVIGGKLIKLIRLIAFIQKNIKFFQTIIYCFKYKEIHLNAYLINYFKSSGVIIVLF